MVIYLAPQFLAVLVGLAIAFFINPLLAGILTFGLISYIIALLKIVPPIITYISEGREAWSDAYGTAWDAVTNYSTVKQAAAEGYESRRIYRKFYDGAFKLWYRVERIWSNIQFSQRVIVVLTQLAVFTTSVFLIQGGSITLGDLVALNGYALIVFGPFVTLGHNWQAVQNGLVAIERAEEILQLGRERVDSGFEFAQMEGRVEFRGVSFAYKEEEGSVLGDVSFAVEPGEVVAFVGESGVGKSTVAELVPGYFIPQKGDVLIDGVSTRDVNVRSLREFIGVVPQEPVLFNDTVGMNIAYGDEDALHVDMERAAREAHADIFINKFPQRYDQLVGERGVKLSVGQKQRIAIARAVLRNPKILILDEPTSALDIQTEKYIQDSLKKLMKGKTTFIIAHRLSTVRRADKILVFQSGQIVEVGRHEDLIKKKGGIYARLYNLHIGIA